MIIDLTQTFLALLPEHMQKPQPMPICLSIQAELCLKQSEQILNSIQKVEKILAQNQENYFSNAAYSYAAFTDQQRNQFDKQMKMLQDSISTKISQLNDVVGQIKFQTTTEKEHLKNMALCLYSRFKTIANTFRDFMEFNDSRKRKLQAMLGTQTKREYKKSHNFEFTHKDPITKSKVSQTTATEARASADSDLQQESKQIYQERMSEQKKIEETRKTLEQINGMLDVMENKVLEQELLTSSFRQIGEIGLFHIEKGNKNLVDANMISKDTGKLWTMFFLGLAFSLLILDYLKS